MFEYVSACVSVCVLACGSVRECVSVWECA